MAAGQQVTGSQQSMYMVSWGSCWVTRTFC